MTKKLLEPALIGYRTVKNRIVMPPMETRLSTFYGDVTSDMIAYYSERARGGAGMIIVENTHIDAISSRSSLASSGLYSDHLIAGKNLLAEAIKEHGALGVIQLSHGGREARESANAFEAVAPSEVMCSVTKRMPRSLTLEEIITIENAFAEAALRAKYAGFDGVEIHGAHGYLVCSFLSPLTNRRNDEYGGSLANRGRFASNIIRKVRQNTGEDFIIGYRISASEYMDGGLEPQEACSFVNSIQESINYISVSAGIYESQNFWAISPTYEPRGQLIPLAAKMKKSVNIPVIAVGAFTPLLAEGVLNDGNADLIAFGRALIADPYMPKKIAENREDDIRPCIRGNEGCASRFYTGCTIRCEVNPACGQENHFRFIKVKKPMKVMVAGGGIAGMEAARVAALLGHNVTIYEKDGRLGGHLIESTIHDFKADEEKFFKWILGQMDKSGVRILLNTPLIPDIIKSEKPDFLIIATGSEYQKPNIKGAENAIIAKEVLEGTFTAGKNTVVIGGGFVGSETALALARNNHKVTIIEMTSEIAARHESSTRQSLISQLQKANVQILVNHTVEEIGAGYVKAKDCNGNISVIKADTSIIATGLVSRTYDKLAGIVPNAVIGDCTEPRKIFECTHEAWKTVREYLSESYIKGI